MTEVWPMGRLPMVVALGLALLTACAHGPPPTEELAAAERALATAGLAGAPRHAAADLARAEAKLAAARRAMVEGANDRAWLLAVQARVDAELAEATARARIAEADTARLRRRLRTADQLEVAEVAD